MEKNKGTCPVYFHIRELRGDEKIVKAHQSYNITPSDQLIADLGSLVGEEAIRYATRGC
jgi:hypothetical protein